MLNIYEDVINDSLGAHAQSHVLQRDVSDTRVAVSCLLFMWWMWLSTCWGDSLPAGLSLRISPFFFFHAPLTSFSLSAFREKNNINNKYERSLLWAIHFFPLCGHCKVEKKVLSICVSVLCGHSTSHLLISKVFVVIKTLSLLFFSGYMMQRPRTHTNTEIWMCCTYCSFW